MSSQLPYIKQAQSNGFSVLVLNTNEGNFGPEKHAEEAWKAIVQKV